MFPVSSLEMIIGVLIMLFGVGFFSYIMSSLMDIMNSYQAKMGVPDKSEDLSNWVMMILRFQPQQQLNLSLQEIIEKDFTYYWQNDRMMCLDINDPKMTILPELIKK
jgi:predicted protein tyrosine phosphatase